MRSSMLGLLPIFVLFTVNAVVTAPREKFDPELYNREFHRTREDQLKFLREDEHKLLKRSREPLPPVEITEAPNIVKNLITESTTQKLKSVSSESKDMIESFVTPQDDDGVTESYRGPKSRSQKPPFDQEPLNINMTVPPKIFPQSNHTVPVITAPEDWIQNYNKTRNSNDTITDFLPPVTFPDSNGKAPVVNATDEFLEDVETIKTNKNNSSFIPPSIFPKGNHKAPVINATDELIKNLNKTGKTTDKVSTTVEVTASSFDAGTTSLPTVVTATSPTTPITTSEDPCLERCVEILHRQVTSSSPSPAEMKLHEQKKPPPRSMSPGVAVLITIIVLVIIGVIIYMGLLARKRCVEWRSGRPELIINDFDASDVDNFEL